VLQYQTRSELDGDYKSLQVAVNKRFSNRWSSRVAYTWQRSNFVGVGIERRVWLDNDLRADYGRFQFDRAHVLNLNGTFNVFEGLTLSAVVSAQSGAPGNEITGADDNRDNDRNDRPIQGVTDHGVAIASDVDSPGRAVPYGIDGPSYVELNLSVRYNLNLGADRSVGFFWDMFNVTNRTNLTPIVSNRASGAFLTSTSSYLPRQMQLGMRFTF